MIIWARIWLLISILGLCKRASCNELSNEFLADFNTQSLQIRLSWSIELRIPCWFQRSVLTNSPLMTIWAKTSLLLSIVGLCKLASYDRLSKEFLANFNTQSLRTRLSWSFEPAIPYYFQCSELANSPLMIIWARNSLLISILGLWEPTSYDQLSREIPVNLNARSLWTRLSW